MIFEQISVGGDRNFAYLIGDRPGGTALVIDPSYSPMTVGAIARSNRLTIGAIACTHGHPDHTNGNDDLRSATGAEVWLHRSAAENGERPVEDGERIRVGDLEVRVIHTPGHTPDSVCYLVGGNLFSGDTLFVGKVGGTGFGEDARAEFDSLHRKILALPDETEVWPGHDYGARPSSTIGEERRTNPFLVQPDFASFLHLKKNWLQYKKEMGIR
jgi:glyoxylase-like metal-dependent hydrolase (beta-lactamase superfamily II)